MPDYMARLNKIKQQVFQISNLSDYLNALSDTCIIAKEMSKDTPTPEELDLLKRLSSVLSHRPGTVDEEQE